MFYTRAHIAANHPVEQQLPRHSVRSRRITRTSALILTLFGLLLSGISGLMSAYASTPLSTSECLARSNKTTLSGTYGSQYKVGSPGSDKTYDARGATFTAYPNSTLYPFTLGASSPGVRMCVVGGKVVGQQSRNLTWQDVKTNYDGDALRFAGNDWYVVDGFRADNIEDALAPRGTDGKFPKDGDGFEIRNAYTKYIRDDCVENDDIAGGVVRDSLFDGCNTGVSERPTKGTAQWNYPAPAGETVTFDHVLLRLQAMPGPRGTNDPSVLGHGQLFKWSSVGNKVVLKDTIFLVEKKPNTGSSDFPAGTVASNVTIVYLPGGSFPGKLPASGVKVTSDRSVWDAARTKWLERHGCTSFDSCTKLQNPDPYDTTSPSPSPTTSPSPEPTISPSPSPSPAPVPVTLTFGAAADAMIRKNRPGTNYGSMKNMTIDGDLVRDSLLKFNVSGIGSRTVQRARLVLWCTDGSSAGGRLARVANTSWSESTVTWSNAPPADPTSLAVLGPVAAGTSYTIDVTSLINTDGTFSIRMSLGSTNAAGYATEESTTASMRPRLIVEAA